MLELVLSRGRSRAWCAQRIRAQDEGVRISQGFSIKSDKCKRDLDCRSNGLLPRSAARMVVISSHSATTSGSLTSPPA